MSEMQEVTFDPQWDVADRLQKALRLAGMSAPEMARFLSVHRHASPVTTQGYVMESPARLRQAAAAAWVA